MRASLFAFVNFSSDIPITSIQFHQTGGGFELDNVTLASVVPEPAEWSLIILGFAAVGMSVRRTRTVVTA